MHKTLMLWQNQFIIETCLGKQVEIISDRTNISWDKCQAAHSRMQQSVNQCVMNWWMNKNLHWKQMIHWKVVPFALQTLKAFVSLWCRLKWNVFDLIVLFFFNHHNYSWIVYKSTNASLHFIWNSRNVSNVHVSIV